MGKYNSEYKPTQEEFEKEYPVDFGLGVRGRWYSSKGIDHAGIIIAHFHPDKLLCCVAVSITEPNNRGAQWTRVCEEPLTLTPSILDTSCGLNGHITNGKWVSC